jgi:predicted extracellular nuclease
MSKALSARISTSFCALLTFISFAAAATPMQAASSGLVISQVYGGGGNSGATLKNDFIEIFNAGGTAVNVTGWSVQYASAAGTSWQVTNLTGILQPGQYYLIQEAVGAGGTVNLPTPDATGTIAMSATTGKVALVNTTTALSGSGCPFAAGERDFIGYGSGVTCSETSPAPGLINTTADLRAGGGCTDTNNNSTDFSAGAPNPRNTASAFNACTGAPLTMTNASPLPSGTVNQFYTTTFTANGGTGSGYTFSQAAGTFPPELTLTGATLSGSPTTTGTFNFTIQVTDSGSNNAQKQFELTIFPAPTCTPTNTIAQIQGSGNASLLAGSTITTNGIVTGRKSNGFFIQMPSPGDGDPNTSDGIFVFTSSTPTVNAGVGNDVCVSGKVQEFIPSSDPASPSQTEIASPTNIFAISTGNALPPPVVLTTFDTDPNGALLQLEKYEGMRVQVDSLTVVAPTRGNVDEANASATSAGIFYGVITGTARPFREPGIQLPDPLPAGSLCCVTRWDTNPEVLSVNSVGIGGAALDVTPGQTITDLIGPIEFSQRAFTIDTDPAIPPSVSGDAMKFVSVSATATPQELSVASFNMQRFFDTTNDPAVQDVALTTTAFNNRLNKASLAIRNVLRYPDILGVEEMENLATLQAVANKVNNDAVTAGDPSPNYQAYLVEGNDIGGIDVGFLVKTPKVNVIDVTQYGRTTTYIDPTMNASALLNDRPPLVLRATVQSPDSVVALPVTVIVNHLRSLSGIDDPTDGARVRAKREAQAEYLAHLIQGDPPESRATSPSENVISIGDYNAFQFNDGYVDVIGVVKGSPVPANMVVTSPATITSPTLTDLVDTDTVSADQRYSYTFNGNAQEIDHILVNPNAQTFFERLEYGRVNADFPEVYRNDPNRPERISDHDPVVAYFALDTTPPVLSLPANIVLEATSSEGAVATFTVRANDAVDGPTSVSCDHTSGATYPLGTTVVACSSTDARNNTATGQFTIKVQDTTPPVVAVTGVSDGASYTLGAVPVSGCSTSDAVSGVANFATVQITGGTSNGTGTFTATCSGGSDNAGNTAAPVSVTYQVGYVFNGFFAPLSPGIAGPFKAGSAVPLKWQLKNGSGSAVGSLSSIKSIQMAYNGDCAGSPDDAPVVADSPGSSGLRFDGTQFGFNWKTPNSASAGCYSIMVGLDDGSTHSQIVILK